MNSREIVIPNASYSPRRPAPKVLTSTKIFALVSISSNIRAANNKVLFLIPFSVQCPEEHKSRFARRIIPIPLPTQTHYVHHYTTTLSTLPFLTFSPYPKHPWAPRRSGALHITLPPNKVSQSIVVYRCFVGSSYLPFVHVLRSLYVLLFY